MRATFRLMLIVSIIAFVGGCYDAALTMAHNHSGDRDRTLQGFQEPFYVVDHRNGAFGATREELSKCDEAVVQAYEAATAEDTRLTAGYSRLWIAYNVLVVLMFAVGLHGLRGQDAKSVPRPVERASLTSPAGAL